MQVTPDVFSLNSEGFKTLLSERTTPEKVFKNAPGIYNYMRDIFHQNCDDSLLREWAFQWACEGLNINYQVIYDRWLG